MTFPAPSSPFLAEQGDHALRWPTTRSDIHYQCGELMTGWADSFIPLASYPDLTNVSKKKPLHHVSGFILLFLFSALLSFYLRTRRAPAYLEAK